MRSLGVLACVEKAIGKRRAPPSARRRCSSTAALGLRVEREVAEWTGVASGDARATVYANGKKKPYARLHRFTRAVLELLEQEQLVLTRSQHPVRDTVVGVHTKLDFVAKSDRTGETVVLELKTGMDKHTKTERDVVLSSTEQMPDTPLSRAMLQAGVGGMLYERTRPPDQTTLLRMWNPAGTAAASTAGAGGGGGGSHEGASPACGTLHVAVKVATIVVNSKHRGAKIHHQTPLWRRRTELLYRKIAAVRAADRRREDCGAVDGASVQ
ncbi:MAG: hypothetical protein CMI16_03125 [Opitutaceae bacterium]|nr:hypothetical protein [Opitutaceae bacterium]